MSAPITQVPAFLIPDAMWVIDRDRVTPEPWCWDLVSTIGGKGLHVWVWLYTEVSTSSRQRHLIGKYCFAVPTVDNVAREYSDRIFGDAGVFDTFEAAARACEYALITHRLTGTPAITQGDGHGM